MRVAVVRSGALYQGRKALQAGPYAHPTFAVDRSIAISRRTIERAQVRLANQLAERERLLEENKRLRVFQDGEN